MPSCSSLIRKPHKELPVPQFEFEAKPSEYDPQQRYDTHSKGNTGHSKQIELRRYPLQNDSEGNESEDQRPIHRFRHHGLPSNSSSHLTRELTHSHHNSFKERFPYSKLKLRNTSWNLGPKGQSVDTTPTAIFCERTHSPH